MLNSFIQLDAFLGVEAKMFVKGGAGHVTVNEAEGSPGRSAIRSAKKSTCVLKCLKLRSRKLINSTQRRTLFQALYSIVVPFDLCEWVSS